MVALCRIGLGTWDVHSHTRQGRSQWTLDPNTTPLERRTMVIIQQRGTPVGLQSAIEAAGLH
jgi:hypothetical protein